MWPRPSSKDSSEGTSATYPWLLGGVALLEGLVEWSQIIWVFATLFRSFNIINVFHCISIFDGLRKERAEVLPRILNCLSLRCALPMTPIALRMPLQKPPQQMHEGLMHFDLRGTSTTSNMRRWHGDGKRHRQLPWRRWSNFSNRIRTSAE